MSVTGTTRLVFLVKRIAFGDTLVAPAGRRQP